ncbi:histidine phosphatase superfamily [Ilyonectria sp. MPI-CAGE-AT-0026]|nr:histidine phosphatase superfamily [Ilyonectria sp. MPI-CAGE-AT-0026]
MSLSLLAVVGGLAASAAAETIHGAVVFSRHGDRTTKWYGAQSLTSLGAEQNYQVGSEYRSRYLEADSPNQILGISEDKYVSSQLFASAPDQGILMNTATAFLQGFYPPLGEIAPEIASQTLNNGTNSTSPIDGYQYVVLHGINDNSPDTIWIKGDDSCPAYRNSSKAFMKSEIFQERVDATSDFYAGFYDVLSDGVYNLKPENMTYANAYNIFDLVNVARIHNATSPARNVSDEDLFQLRTLSDSAELGLNWNVSEPARAIGAETLFGVVLTQLNQTVATEGKLKFSLFAGSYDTFMAFFGVAELLDVSPDFHGLPDYASTMAFELFSDDTDQFPSDPEADLRVRWLFKNGTTGELNTYPLFSTNEDSLPWSRFVTEVEERAILDIGDWCEQCSATEDFCAAYQDDESAETEEDDDDDKEGGKSGGMSNAVAGVIGAFVTLGVVGIVGAAVFLMKRRKAETHGEKSSVRSGSTDANATPDNV